MEVTLVVFRLWPVERTIVDGGAFSQQERYQKRPSISEVREFRLALAPYNLQGDALGTRSTAWR